MIRTENIEGVPGGLILYDVLSHEECLYHINRFESSVYQHVSVDGYDSSYRDNYRTIIDDKELATLVFDRINIYIDDTLNINLKNYKEQGITLNSPNDCGVWKMSNINDHIRYCKYLPGGHFAPHYDAFYCQDETHRSFKTVMIYLNDNFEGGTTRFLSGTNQVLHSIKPRSGMALIFNHTTNHDGEKVSNGNKYMFRTDLMFEQILKYDLDDALKNAQIEWEKGKREENLGNAENAVKHYSKAEKLFPTFFDHFF